jgi:hypothetical protein
MQKILTGNEKMQFQVLDLLIYANFLWNGREEEAKNPSLDISLPVNEKDGFRLGFQRRKRSAITKTAKITLANPLSVANAIFTFERSYGFTIICS